MTGLDPVIHAVPFRMLWKHPRCGAAWMAVSSTAMTCDRTLFLPPKTVPDSRGLDPVMTVNGSGDKIEAELLAGSRVKIVGDNSILQFVLAGDGADPIVSVSGDKSRAYRIQRMGATSRADASTGATPTAAGMRVLGGAGGSVTEMNAVPQPTGE